MRSVRTTIYLRAIHHHPYQVLNTPASSRRSIRPLEIIDALAQHSKGKHNALFSSREHQDAQELFQLLSEAIKTEANTVHKEGLRDRGLGGLAPLRPGASSGASSSSVSAQATTKDSEISRGVFDGLTANRRSCMECGYTEAVMHFAFDNWQLSVPRQVRSASEPARRRLCVLYIHRLTSSARSSPCAFRLHVYD